MASRLFVIGDARPGPAGSLEIGEGPPWAIGTPHHLMAGVCPLTPHWEALELQEISDSHAWATPICGTRPGSSDLRPGENSPLSAGTSYGAQYQQVVTATATASLLQWLESRCPPSLTLLEREFLAPDQRRVLPYPRLRDDKTVPRTNWVAPLPPLQKRRCSVHTMGAWARTRAAIAHLARALLVSSCCHDM